MVDNYNESIKNVERRRRCKSFVAERDIINLAKIDDLLYALPSFCVEFFIGIENNTTPLTRLNYAHDLKAFFNYLCKKSPKFNGVSPIELTLRDLAKVDATDIERFLSYLSHYVDEEGVERTNSANGKHRKLSTIRSMFKYFYNKDKLPENVSAKVTTPKIREKEIIRLNQPEIQRVLKIAETGSGLSVHARAFNERDKARNVAMLTLFLGTGIRISECVGLNIEDIDFNANSFTVTRKGGNRVILYFSDEVANALKWYLEVRTENKSIPEDERALFVSAQNRRISIRAVENIVKKYALVATPLKKISPHKLRSTYGTRLYEETRDIYVVAEVLGHKDVNTTKRHYAATSENIRKNAADKVKLYD